MNLSVNHHRKLNQIVPVPEGLAELMSDIAREVLRFQPSNIEEFIAEYLESMLLTRELYALASQTVENVLDSTVQIVELFNRNGFTMGQCDAVIKVMQEEFRIHFEKMREEDPLKELNIITRLVKECKLSIDQAHKASEIIENAWCYYYQRNKRAQSFSSISPDIAQHEAVKHTLEVYQKARRNCSDVVNIEKVSSITLAGYLQRKNQKSDESLNANSKENWRTPNFQQRELAALKIQAKYRLHLNHKKMLKAANVIRDAYKGYKTKKKSQNKAEEDQRRHKAARVIQSWFLGAREKRVSEKAAVVIQSHVRGFLARQKLKNAMKTNESV